MPNVSQPSPKPPPDFLHKSHRFWWAFLVLGVLALAFWWFFGRGMTDNEQMVKDDGEALVYEPVRYDVQCWQLQQKLPALSSGILIKQIGDTATKDTGLDIKGQRGDLYRYHAKDEPPIYVIDSEDFFELAWYYATPTDSDEDKQASQKYAKTAYGVATDVLGQSGVQTMTDILTNQSPKDKPAVLVLAQCQEYMCRLVFDKKAW